MRHLGRLLAIVTITALLAPGVRWMSNRTSLERCACLPNACMCPMHHQGMGHVPSCCSGGGQCGLNSPDSFISSLLSNLIFVPTEHPLLSPLNLSAPVQGLASLYLLPAHTQLLDHPPRPTL